MGCSPVGVLGSPGCREGLAVGDGMVFGLGMEGEGWGERAAAAMQEGVVERRRDRALSLQRGKAR